MQRMPLAWLTIANVNLCFKLKAAATQGEENIYKSGNSVVIVPKRAWIKPHDSWFIPSGP
ncbi:hypothetical protein BCON_0082g00050 [Botryotinia convoluta]|uniref:Uncharacterized protein n=1 Tax=Botryotinia convoluta TaxID=54673 RepID=A0A4Z1IH64_9HELO|nr:hypothetical protein BCON_0082g00050 [Botryotinia convoluta]